MKFYVLTIRIGDTFCPPYLFISLEKAKTTMYTLSVSFFQNHNIEIDGFSPENLKEIISDGFFFDDEGANTEISDAFVQIGSHYYYEGYEAEINEIRKDRVEDGLEERIFRERKNDYLRQDAIYAFCDYFDLAERYGGLVSTEDFEEFMYSEYPNLDTDGLHQLIDDAVYLFEKHRNMDVADYDTWKEIIRGLVKRLG